MNAAPEAALQRQVVAHLRMYLPSEVWWTASLSGIKLPIQAAARAKAHGVNRGALDLSFIWPDGISTYIELKSRRGRLTPEQAMLADRLKSRMATCWTLADVRIALEDWMAAHGLRWLTDTEAYRRSTT